MATTTKTLTPTEALQALEGTADKGALTVLKDVVNKSIVQLATDEAFALRDDKGEIRAFKQRLTLSGRDGTLVQPVPGGPFVISAQGYEVWAEAAGAAVIFPRKVLVDGQWQDNPHILRDPANKRILAIYARACAFRFSSKGIPQVSDWSTIFDNPSYRMIDLLAKAKKFPQAFRLLPNAMEPGEDGTWSKYPFDESSSLWVNTSHEEALQWFAQIINREKKALDFAQTFARRNALKHLSGLQKAPGPEWTFPVFCWRPVNDNIIKWDSTRYANLQDRVESIIQGGDDFAQLPEAETRQRLTNGTEHVEGQADETVDPEDQPAIDAEFGHVEPESGPGLIKPEGLSKEEFGMVRQYRTAKKSFPEPYEEACEALGLKAFSADHDHAMPQMADIIRKINEILDEG